jgi:hypothetical protein
MLGALALGAAGVGAVKLMRNANARLAALRGAREAEGDLWALPEAKKGEALRRWFDEHRPHFPHYWNTREQEAARLARWPAKADPLSRLQVVPPPNRQPAQVRKSDQMGRAFHLDLLALDGLVRRRVLEGTVPPPPDYGRKQAKTPELIGYRGDIGPRATPTMRAQAPKKTARPGLPKP